MTAAERPSLVWLLIKKDLRIHRFHMGATILCGAAALGLMMLRREPVTVVAITVFFISLIFASAMLAGGNIFNERKRQNLPFVMSLPISTTQYTTSKLAGTVIMFMIPWLAMLIAAVWAIAVVGVLPHGTIPLAVMLLTLPFIGLCIVASMTLIGETEGWMVAANVLCNSSYGLVWYFITISPSLMRDIKSPHAVWNSAVLTFLGCEFGIIALVLSFTYLMQSRKTDFV